MSHRSPETMSRHTGVTDWTFAACCCLVFRQTQFASIQLIPGYLGKNRAFQASASRYKDCRGMRCTLIEAETSWGDLLI